jgi:hypothetical protein
MTTQTETKRQSAIEAEVRRESDGLATGLTLTFANGKRLMINADQLTSAIAGEALIHGLKQKLVDAAAISRNPDTGKSATVDDKYAAVRAVYDRLLSGEWNAPREGGGSGSLLLAALVRQTGKPEDQLREWLGKKSDAEKKALSLNPKVAEHINAIRAERAKVEGIDSDAILGELE